MDRKEIVDFITQNPLSFMATVAEDGSPRVRGMMTCRIDDQGILFATGHVKEVCHQVKADPRIELCYYDAENRTQVRVRGEVEFLEDRPTKEEVLERFPFLKPRIEAEGWDTLAVFILRKGQSTTWSMAAPFVPNAIVDF